MVEKRIDSVKKEIRSVLISSKDGLLLDDFCKTYRNLLGTRLPTREFGFTSDIEFLYSLPDVVHVQVERNGSYQLYGIADETTEHIQKLVSRQRQPKVNPKRKSKDYSKVTKCYQTFVPIVTQRCRSFVPALLRSEIIEIVKQYPDGIGYLLLIQAYKNVYKKEINLEWLSSDPDERFKKLADAIPELDLKLTHNQLKIYLNFHRNEVKDKDASASYCRLQHLKAKSSPKFKSIEIDRKQNCLDVSAIPENVKSNFVKVLKQYPKGILAVHFPILYEKLIETSLDLHELGYSSLLELADALPDIFSRENVPENSKDWILLHAGFTKLASKPSTKFSPSYCLKGNIPPDIAQPSLPYIQKEVPDDAIEKFIPVFVSSVINPGLFWIQLQSKEAISNLVKLEKEMKSFYGIQGNNYRMADADVLIGSSCVAFSTTDFHWYRALITSLPSIDYVNVTLVDYGNWEKIHRSNLFYLKYTFINLPAHAHKSRLASIKPINQLSKWSVKAQARFLKLCNHVSIMAKIDSSESKPSQDDTVSLFLCVTSGDEDIHINDVLVNEGFAEFCLSDIFYSNSPNAVNLSIEKGVELSSNHNSLKQTVCKEKRDISVPETSKDFYLRNGSEKLKFQPKREREISNGFHLSNGSEKPKFQPKRLFVEKLEAQKLSSKKKRYVKKVLLGDGYKVNIIVVGDEAYVSGGDLCNLFWSDKEADVLALRLRFKDAIIPTISVSNEDFEELFFQCKRYSVKGFQDMGKETSVVLYPLKYVMKILNIFGHASLRIRETLCKEITNFDPHDVFWNEFQQPEEDETVLHAQNTLDRLCLYDLKALHEVLRFKRLKLMKDIRKNSSNVTEINKIELMQSNIMKQMDAINSICSQYMS